VLPYVLPYLLYVGPPVLGPVLPESWGPWLDPARIVAAAAALVVHWTRGELPELRERRTPRASATWLALAAGFVVAALWMPLADAVPRLGERTGFDPQAAGAAAAPWLLGARVAGFVLVIPVAEELLVRCLVPRWADATDDWRRRGVGEFTLLSASVSVLFFAASHPEWLAALATGVLWTGLLAATRRLRDAVLAHAVANAVLAAWWLHTGDLSWW
jgi:CAAX prenyl protease-like protein